MKIGILLFIVFIIGIFFIFRENSVKTQKLLSKSFLIENIWHHDYHRKSGAYGEVELPTFYELEIISEQDKKYYIQIEADILLKYIKKESLIIDYLDVVFNNEQKSKCILSINDYKVEYNKNIQIGCMEISLNRIKFSNTNIKNVIKLDKYDFVSKM